MCAGWLQGTIWAKTSCDADKELKEQNCPVQQPGSPETGRSGSTKSHRGGPDLAAGHRPQEQLLAHGWQLGCTKANPFLSSRCLKALTAGWHFIQPCVAWDFIIVSQNAFITILKSSPLALHKNLSFYSEKKTHFCSAQHW